MIPLGVFGMSAYEASAAAKQLMANFRLALQRAGLSMKQAALLCGMKEQHFSHDVTTGRLPLGRFADLPDEAQDALYEIELQRRGKQVVDKDLGRLLDGLSEIVGRRRMARFEASEQKKEGAA